MKKLSAFLMVLILSASSLGLISATASARVAGNYYYTDIVTYLWNTPVNSINIGGVTLIDAESMRHYGFTVNWHGDRLHLEIIDNRTQSVSPQAAGGSLLDMSAGTAATVAGQYYYTDIRTTLNGTTILSYNIGGRTFIGAEEMRAFGYNVIWDGAALTLRIQSAAPVVPPVTPPASPSAIPPTRGVWNGNVYSSQYLGLRFNMPSSWFIVSDTELAEMIGVLATGIGTGLGIPDSFWQTAENIGFFEMSALNPFTGANINIVIERLPNDMPTSAYLNQAMLTMAMLGIPVTRISGSTIIGATEWLATESDMGAFKLRQLMNVQNGFARVISIGYFSDSQLTDILAMFSGY
jgi:hypothetical protein